MTKTPYENPKELVLGGLNLVTRSLTLLAKFGLIIYIGKYMSLADLGSYSILIGVVYISIQIFGFDFYQYNTREILSVINSKKAGLVLGQLRLHIFSYLLITVPLFFILQHFMPASPMGGLIVIGIVCCEHFSQELTRLFVTLKRPLLANFILFVRSGLPLIIFMAVSSVHIEVQNLESLIIFWFWGALSSSVLGIFIILKTLKRDLIIYPDKEWVVSGIKVAAPFFAMTMFGLVIEWSDRFLLNYYLGEHDVGVYSFSVNIAGTLTLFIATGFLAIVSPKLIEAYKMNDMQLYRLIQRRLDKGLLFGGLFGLLVLWVIFPVLVSAMDRPELGENAKIFYILSIAAYFNVLSMSSYYKLYIAHGDPYLLITIATGAIVNLFLNVIFIPYFGLLGAAISSLLAYTLVLTLREYFSRSVVGLKEI